MTTIYVQDYECPTCRRKLGFDNKARFGPPLVKCVACGTNIQTGMSAWSDLWPSEKRKIALLEIVAPSFALTGSSVIGAIAFNLFLCFFISGSIGGVIMVKFDLVIVGLVAMFLVYPILLLVRLIVMIRKSDKHSRTGELPTI